MDIAFVINESYVQHAGACIASILSNNEQLDQIHFHVLHTNVSKKSQRKLGGLEKYKNYKIDFYNLENIDMSQFSLTIPHITIETYYKIFIPRTLRHLDKVLYLDVDMIIDGDVLELWNTDISKHYAAVVLDPYIADTPHACALDLQGHYFNAGMMLMNLNNLRDIDLEHLSSLALKRFEKPFKYQEQDILNLVFKNHVVWMPPYFNAVMAYFINQKSQEVLAKYQAQFLDDYVDYLNNPKIIHFTGATKPWHFQCISPHKDLYFKYLKSYLTFLEYTKIKIIFFFKVRIYKIFHYTKIFVKKL